MAVDRNETIEEVYQELRNLIPLVFTETNPVSANTFNSFLFALSEELGKTRTDLYDFKDNINVLTAASGIGIEAWENLAGLDPVEGLNLQNRRSRVFSRISAKPTTMAILKNIIENYVSSDQFTVFEYHTLNDPASAFRYKVRIRRPPINDYDEESLLQDLARVQPAHCGLTAELEDMWDTFEEAFSFTESSSGSGIGLFIIGTSTVEGSAVVL